MNRRIRPCNEDGAKADVTVAHSQNEALSAELFPGLQVGKRGVPRDIDMAGHQRIDQGGITRVQGILSHEALVTEVFAHSLPDGDYLRRISDRANFELGLSDCCRHGRLLLLSPRVSAFNLAP